LVLIGNIYQSLYKKSIKIETLPLPKDIMNFRWNMEKIAKNDGHASNLKNLLLDAQKGTKG